MMRSAWLATLAAGCLSFGLPAFAACDFATYEHRDALQNPASVEHISVEIRNSRKWAKNSIAILTSPQRNIEAKRKKKMKADIVVRYDFGTCRHPARVRQNGDWKDHIRFGSGGQILASLDVRLDEGNILGAVRFKLLLPETRNGLSEIFATYLLRKLDFIAPETFMVSADINGAQQEFLFQENAVKELLERNLRREGPILEGDESILWNVEGFEPFDLENVSLARLTNGNWAQKGEISTAIAREAFMRLQTSYLDYARDVDRKEKAFGARLVPNPEPTRPVFETYGALLFAMNATHALRPHNRKFYFNSFERAFEPIYYDGNLSLTRKENSKKRASGDDRDFFLRFTDPQRLSGLVSKIESLSQSRDAETEFLMRAGEDRDAARVLLRAGLEAVASNLDELIARRAALPQTNALKFPQDIADERALLIARTKEAGIVSDFVLPGQSDDGPETVVRLSGPRRGETVELTDLELIELMTDNKLNGRRTVLLPGEEQGERGYKTRLFAGGDILISPGAAIKVDESGRRLTVTQSEPDDWVLIRGAILTGWEVIFDGEAQDPALSATQRFNEFGLTGCLNFYDATLKDTRIEGRRGQCEDSVNLVSSRGSLTELVVTDGFADAIDIDFSQIDIEKLTVSRTGNDCFDVSTGEFRIATADLSGCADKGISVGENSVLKAADVAIQSANIGVSSKDLSHTEIERLTGRDIAICAEAFRKKQEFGGGFLQVADFDCDGPLQQDPESAIVLNGLMQ